MMCCMLLLVIRFSGIILVGEVRMFSVFLNFCNVCLKFLLFMFLVLVNSLSIVLWWGRLRYVEIELN